MKEYIERDAAIFDLEIYEKQVVKDEYALAIAGCRSHIRNIPAADVVEVRHGRWIEDGDCQYCSECGEEHSWADYRAAYCDVCGAKMDGGAGND